MISSQTPVSFKTLMAFRTVYICEKKCKIKYFMPNSGERQKLLLFVYCVRCIFNIKKKNSSMKVSPHSSSPWQQKFHVLLLSYFHQTRSLLFTVTFTFYIYIYRCGRRMQRNPSENRIKNNQFCFGVINHCGLTVVYANVSGVTC